MRSTTLIVSVLAAAFVSAAEIETDDIPNQCRDICRPIVQLTERCEQVSLRLEFVSNGMTNTTHSIDNDDQERTCICEAQNAADFTSCNDCTLQNLDYFNDNEDDDNDNDNDDNKVNNWFGRCNFAAGGGITASITSSSGATTSTMMPISTSIRVDCDDDDNNSCSTSTLVVVAPTSVVVSSIGSGGSSTPSAGSSNDNGDDSNSNSNVSTSTVGGGAAAATGVPVIAAGLWVVAMAAL